MSSVVKAKALAADQHWQWGQVSFFPLFFLFFFLLWFSFDVAREKKKKRTRSLLIRCFSFSSLVQKCIKYTAMPCLFAFTVVCVNVWKTDENFGSGTLLILIFFFLLYLKMKKKKSYSNDPVRVKWRGNGVFVSAVLLLCLLWLG